VTSLPPGSHQSTLPGPENNLESIVPGWLATEAEAEAIEEAERRRIARGVAELHAWDRVCRCCGQGDAGPVDGVCGECRAVLAALRAERLGAETINGHTRRQLAERYLDTQHT